MLQLAVIGILFVQVLGGLIPPKTTPNSYNRLVGGSRASVYQFPFQVSLRYYGTHRCSGVLFQPNVVLTTAQCVQGISNNQLVIVAGITSLYDFGVQRKAQKILPNKSFSMMTFDNDAAIIILETPFGLTSAIQTIKLARRDDVVHGGSVGVVSVWKASSPNGPYAGLLKYSEVAVLNNTECIQAYGESITSNQVCTRASIIAETCDGDSGAPLTIGGKLHGVLSFEFGCEFPELPAVFTRISALRQWIDEQLLIYGIITQ